MLMKTIYLDNGATTKVDPKVLEKMSVYYTEKYGNASSLHHKGQEAKMGLEEARESIAKSINAKPSEIIFTSGGSESNNLAIKGVAFSKNNRVHLITSQIEHHSVERTFEELKKQGYETSFIKVDKEGFVDLTQLENEIKENTVLVSIIHGNNEIGTIQDIESIGKICKKKKVLFHIDAVQSFTKVPIDVKKINVDLISLNAHKIHGPKGVGALYVRDGVKLKKIIDGGDQEYRLRSGTENVPGIIGFAEAVKLANNSSNIKHMTKLRNKLIDGLLSLEDVRLNGPSIDESKKLFGKDDKRLCNNINISFKYVEGESIGGYMDAKGICSSTGSACSSKSLKPSHVLTAIGLTPEEAHGSIRLSLGRFNTEEEIDFVLEVLPAIIKKLRKISPLMK